MRKKLLNLNPMKLASVLLAFFMLQSCVDKKPVTDWYTKTSSEGSIFYCSSSCSAKICDPCSYK